MDIPLSHDFLWTWFLLFVRFSAMFLLLPGIGGDEVPLAFRQGMLVILSLAIANTVPSAVLPDNFVTSGSIIITEFLFGIALGLIPQLIIGACAVSGQVVSAAIGLGQATLIDPSIGEPVAVLARLQSMMAVAVFLTMDGHHALIQAIAYASSEVGFGVFSPADVADLIANRFSHMFELAVLISGPVLVTVLVTQFVLGLLTKFVPQVNIFIISLPLTIGVGLFVVGYTLPSYNRQMANEFSQLDEIAGGVIHSGDANP
jgi:flagellar biosynthesis protein FliR